MRILEFFATLSLTSTATAATDQSALWDRLRSVNPANVTAADCDAHVRQAATLNGPDLFYGSSLCHAAHRPLESSFLLNAGQIRSTVDMVLIVPATRADSDVTVQLYGFIYAYAGGSGSEDVLRDRPSRDRFFTLLDSWSPAYSSDYNPGWSARRRPDPTAYQTAIEEVRDGRRRQLAGIATLYADETYYALHRRMQVLMAQNSNRFVEGSAQANLSRDLQRQMDERAVALGIEGYSHVPDDGQFREPRFPPAMPAADEVPLAEEDDPVIQRCADIAERHTIAADSAVVRVLVTRSPEWGTIWRADIAGGDDSPTRFTCTETTSSSRPMGSPGEAVSPLPPAVPLETDPE